MIDKRLRKKERHDKKRINRLKKFEKNFSAHNYSGKGKKWIETVEGKSVVAIAAPHSVNFFDNGFHEANAYSGALAKLVSGETGCHAICIRKTHDETEQQNIINGIETYITQNGIKALIDLQFEDMQDDAVIVLEKEKGAENDAYGFLSRAVRYSFEYKYRDSGLNKIVEESTASHDSITRRAAGKKKIAYIYIGINKKYVSVSDKEKFNFLYEAFLNTITMLSNLDWDAKKIKVYKLRQSARHKPQDKIEISFRDNMRSGADFDDNSLLNICAYGSGAEKVRLHTPSEKSLEDLRKNMGSNHVESEYVFLTNRLIETLFGREWIIGEEDEPGLMDAPVMVYADEREAYPIGLPKADQIDGVSFSSALYEEKKPESQMFDYAIFNRYTDSRLYVDFKKMDYADHGRVKDSEEKPAKRVMIPRYYKRLLGYLDRPLKMIRKEEYDNILKQLDREEEKEAFTAYYEEIKGEVFYRAKNIYRRDGNGEAEVDSDPDKKQVEDTVVKLQEKLGLYNDVEVLRIPKQIQEKRGLFYRIKQKWDKGKIGILEKMIGKAEYLLKTEWTSETDDRNNIARLSPNMMSLLGVTENDKILVRFGKKQEIMRVLANENLTDYQIGIPAMARKRLGMNSVNDIVIVHRDMAHIFWRHSEEQIVAILGTVLAVYQVITKMWLGVLACLIVAPLIMYFVLNEERLKVK